MKLNEMIDELEERGFEEVPTKKPGRNILSYDGDYNANWRSYMMPNGDLEGFSVFLEEDKERDYLYNVLLVLPDAMQNLYLDALAKLEEAMQISLNPDPESPIDFETNYIDSCYRLKKTMHSGFNALLGKVGINPENELSNVSDGFFKLDFVVLGKYSKKRILGVNYRLGLMSRCHKEEEFYLNIIDQMPEQVQEIESLNSVWNSFVGGLIDCAKSNKQFYQAIGVSYYS